MPTSRGNFRGLYPEYFGERGEDRFSEPGAGHVDADPEITPTMEFCDRCGARWEPLDDRNTMCWDQLLDLGVVV